MRVSNQQLDISLILNAWSNISVRANHTPLWDLSHMNFRKFLSSTQPSIENIHMKPFVMWMRFNFNRVIRLLLLKIFPYQNHQQWHFEVEYNCPMSDMGLKMLRFFYYIIPTDKFDELLLLISNQKIFPIKSRTLQIFK